MTPLYCSGCWRPMGWVQNRVPGYIFCSQSCADEAPVFHHESRDAIVTLLAREGVPHEKIAAEMGVTRARIQQIVRSRMTLQAA